MGVCEIEFSHIGKISENSDMVCKKIILKKKKTYKIYETLVKSHKSDHFIFIKHAKDFT